MDVHQTSSALDEMSSALAYDDQMVDNVVTVTPIELTNATGMYLQDLNEDCLLEIFSHNSLTPMDLCAVAETCKRFKQITQRLFSKGFVIEHRYSAYEFVQTFSSKEHSTIGCTIQDLERILKNFGSHLSELHVSDKALVNLVAKYCGDITLKRLEIFYLDLESMEGVTQQLSSIFRRLQQLHVHHACNFLIAPSDMNFDSLIELEIESSTTGAALLRCTFPILVRFRFTYFYHYKKDNCEALLIEFVRRHGCLKTIKLTELLYDNHICKLLDAISDSCNELEKLTLGRLQYGCFDISHLQSLAKLKALTVVTNRHCSCGEYIKSQCEQIDFSQAFKSLKKMKISSFDYELNELPNQIIEVLSQLQGVRELKLVYFDLADIPWTQLTQLRKVYLCGTIRSCYGSVLINIIRSLINLEELTYELDTLESFNGANSPLTEDVFSKIVKIVERRAHVLTLARHYDFIYDENCNGKRNVQLIKLSDY